MKTRLSIAISLAFRKSVVLRSVKVAALVGFALIWINHYDRILAGNVDLVLVMKMLLTLLVPYLVSTYGAVSALMDIDNPP